MTKRQMYRVKKETARSDEKTGERKSKEKINEKRETVMDSQ